jgi:predicted phage terminase large subunit-like protein
LKEQRSRSCRQSFEKWCVEALHEDGFRPQAHHKVIIKELELVEAGITPRLMLLLPPGSAKSTYGSHLFPPWFIARKPGRRLIAASHTMEYAEDIGRVVRNIVTEHEPTLGYSINPDERSAGRWRTSNDGFYLAAGVGGSVTGRRADLAIIDDPVKSREEAESESVRERNWKWFNSDLRTRLKPGGRIVLIMTRWHQDDLGGRLIEYQGRVEEGGDWKVVSIPATAIENDPLGREPGEMLWADDPTYAYGDEILKVKREYEKSGAMRDWYSLYEQTPRAAEGALFDKGKITVLETPPHRGMTVRAWDLAATEQVGTKNPDWTVGLKLTRLPDGTFCILDIVRFRGGPSEVEKRILETAEADGGGVTIGLPQDPGQAGKAQIKYLTSKLAGYKVVSSPESGNKATRAASFASQVNVGNVSIMRGSYVLAYLSEMADFPSGVKDDQIDASSRAFDMLVGGGPILIDDDLLELI